jgi:hypothetical protein
MAKGDKELDASVLNITKTSNTSSVMFLKYEYITARAVVILFAPPREFYCQVGTVKSATFKFEYGGKTLIYSWQPTSGFSAVPVTGFHKERVLPPCFSFSGYCLTMTSRNCLGHRRRTQHNLPTQNLTGFKIFLQREAALYFAA